MTDNTQPEAREFTMSQYASKDDMIGAMRKRIAELESELEAVGAGGVQALSAAPAGWKLVPVNPTPEMWKAAKSVPDPNPPYPPHYGLVWDAMLAASPTPPAEQQAVPKAAPGDALDEALRERDDAEDFIDATLDEVLGHERPEWSSSYGRADALNDVQERMTALHKPAVDKAWGRFQSAMAAPQQEAQEPCGWDGAEEWEKLAWHLCAEENGEDACNDLIWDGGPIPEPWGDRWLKYEGEARRMIALVRTHVPALQPAPAPLSDEALNCLDALAAPKAAPGERLDECFPGESRVAVPQGLISAACFAIRNKRDGGKVLEQLRRYSVGDLSQPLAPQQEAQEPVAWQSRTRPTWGGNTRPWSPWEPCTKEQAEDCWKTPLLHDWAYEARALFTASQPAPAPLSDDAKRLNWLLWKLPGDALRYVVGELSDTSSGAEFRAAIDAALAAQGGK